MLNSTARLKLSIAVVAEVARLWISLIASKVWRLRLPISAAAMLGLVVGWLLLVAAVDQTMADEPAMRLRLKDGSFSAGTIVGATQDDHIGWQNDLFERPFEFNVQSIRSLARSANSATSPDSSIAEQPLAADGSSNITPAGQVLEMAGGSAVVGTLTAMDEGWLTVESPMLGTVRVSRDMVVAISDAGYAGQVVYSGPLDESHWQRLGDTSDWDFEAGALVARRPLAAIVGDVNLPKQAQINLALSWNGTPDFVLSLGTLASNRVSKVDEVPSAARLEVWANQLALVREVDGGADIAMLAELNSVNPRVELSLYLDQVKGTIVACDAHGRLLETLRVEGKDPKVRTAVHLVNNGPSLTLERFEIRQWDGVIASVAEAGDQFLLDSSGQRTEAGIAGFDAESGELLIALADGDEQRLPLSQLRRGSVTHAANPGVDTRETNNIADAADEVTATDEKVDTSGNASGDAEAGDAAENQSASTDTAQLVEVVLMDRTRLKGRMLATTDSNQLRFEAVGLSSIVPVPLVNVRGVIGNADRYFAEVVEQPLGTLKSDQQQLSGFLAPANEGTSEGSLAIVWHPQGSSVASPLSPSATGAITYRAPLPQPLVDTAEKASQPIQAIAPAIGMFLGRRQAAANADPAQAAALEGGSADGKPGAAKLAQAREILFRTGDAVDGVVDHIDDSGMRFRSQQTSTQFVPHNLIEHVWLNKMNGESTASPEKLKRLMTVPRSMKQDPPTHLFIAVNGDYLRGRLVSLQDDKMTVEIRLETVELQTSTIAQIVWLHDRDWPQKETAAPDKDLAVDEADADTAVKPADAARKFLVHAIGRNERGLTFHPQALADGKLSGVSDLLGQCSIAVSDVNQLLFGADVSQMVRAYRDDPWTLSLAQLPRVYMDDGSEPLSGNLGDASPMVGHVATEFTLQTLAGEKFRLSDHRDRVVVLDFWASWCGPCVQTMPLVEEAVAELGSDKVQLVAINIQEPAARVQAAVDRLQMSSTVLLDIDGQVAGAYQANAIPQTVIIDRGGNVTHVFVGGGARFVAHFKEALQTVAATPGDGSPVDGVNQ